VVEEMNVGGKLTCVKTVDWGFSQKLSLRCLARSLFLDRQLDAGSNFVDSDTRVVFLRLSKLIQAYSRKTLE
jgi:hypothetical protein